MNSNFTQTEIDPSVYLLERIDADSTIILKEFKNFDESLKNWDEAVEELKIISEDNRDRFFSIKGIVMKGDGYYQIQESSF